MRLGCAKHGLCRRCNGDPLVKSLYSTAHIWGARRGIMVDFNGSGAVPAESTGAPPGSLAKMNVMRLRMLRRERLHHPGDNLEQVLRLVNPFADCPNWTSGTPTGLVRDEG